MSQPITPPVGTVTFLFTDIEGSTRLWQEQPEKMRGALARHDALLQGAISAHQGYVFKTVGDAFYAAFATPGEALGAALACQQALLSEPWDAETPIGVRAALHTGVAQERGGDYFGTALNRVARLLAAAHGGQTLLSQTAYDLVRDHLPPAVGALDLGAQRLKDLTRPEQVYQLVHPSLPASFPPLRSLDALPNNLPQQVTSFIGRDKEVGAVKELVRQNRLVTILGMGGAGKTRLSLQAGADLLDGSGDGVWLVELAALSDPALVPKAVAETLGVAEEAGMTVTRSLLESLRAKRLLLLLDNCEHVLGACAELAAALLRACPGVSILASSREALGVSGEQAYRIPPLSVPDPKQRQSALGLSQFEAVGLFTERAKLVQPAFAVSDANAPAVAEVCFRLDGIPLAIELAAARVRSLTVEEINAKLDKRFRLLTGGSRTALPRSATSETRRTASMNGAAGISARQANSAGNRERYLMYSPAIRRVVTRRPADSNPIMASAAREADGPPEPGSAARASPYSRASSVSRSRSERSRTVTGTPGAMVRAASTRVRAGTR